MNALDNFENKIRMPLSEDAIRTIAELRSFSKNDFYEWLSSTVDSLPNSNSLPGDDEHEHPNLETLELIQAVAAHQLEHSTDQRLRLMLMKKARKCWQLSKVFNKANLFESWIILNNPAFYEETLTETIKALLESPDQSFLSILKGPDSEAKAAFVKRLAHIIYSDRVRLNVKQYNMWETLDLPPSKVNEILALVFDSIGSLNEVVFSSGIHDGWSSNILPWAISRLRLVESQTSKYPGALGRLLLREPYCPRNHNAYRNAYLPENWYLIIRKAWFVESISDQDIMRLIYGIYASGQGGLPSEYCYSQDEWTNIELSHEWEQRAENPFYFERTFLETNYFRWLDGTSLLKSLDIDSSFQLRRAWEFASEGFYNSADDVYRRQKHLLEEHNVEQSKVKLGLNHRDIKLRMLLYLNPNLESSYGFILDLRDSPDSSFHRKQTSSCSWSEFQVLEAAPELDDDIIFGIELEYRTFQTGRPHKNTLRPLPHWLSTKQSSESHLKNETALISLKNTNKSIRRGNLSSLGASWRIHTEQS